ncbi:transcriptional regulator of the spore photoproduct lyase operon [Mesobacillus foraminis]|uniref:Transcriptional regulator of the spore photoproduct lyase operon n=2 Tax=Mesobacillus foraminis TaxID=279826 RepID=A0A4R2BEN6_9BACI|nr:transcriptional regulator of the spore photoproduct lyase operon [Mesobacillus foraminis]
MDMLDPGKIKQGDEVFVIYRNPHVPTVANIKAAEIVAHPKDPGALALFLNETFHVIEDDDALFASEDAAKQAYDNVYSQDEPEQYFS